MSGTHKHGCGKLLEDCLHEGHVAFGGGLKVIIKSEPSGPIIAPLYWTTPGLRITHSGLNMVYSFWTEFSHDDVMIW